jgi:hypothetical protein
MDRLQALLLAQPKTPSNQPDDRQGRDCPRPPVNDATERVAVIGVYAVTLIAAVAGFVHLAARAGWL